MSEVVTINAIEEKEKERVEGISVITPDDRLKIDYSEILSKYESQLKPDDTTAKINVAVDVGTSNIRAVDWATESFSVNPNRVIRLVNRYDKLGPSDLEDLRRLSFEEKSFNSAICYSFENITNEVSPLYENEVTISKGLISDKLRKTSNYGVSNSSKYNQAEEYIINTYTAIVAVIYHKMLYFLERGDVASARSLLNVSVNLANMLPDEEKNSQRHEELKRKLAGTVKYKNHVLGIEGKFTIMDNPPTSWAEIYGEAECAVYYYIIKNPTEKNKKAFSNHCVSVADCGEGSFDIAFFKNKEYLEGSSETNRTVNGSTLLNRTLKKLDLKFQKEGRKNPPSLDALRRVLNDNPEELVLETAIEDIDISECLTEAKIEIAGEMANIYKNVFEKNSSITGGVDNLFLLILAGRVMTGCDKSPSLGQYFALRLEEQLGIPAKICKVTHPDSSLLGAALKLAMRMHKTLNKTVK